MQNATVYFVDVSVGTPPQPVRMQIDTGSSTYWMNTPSSAFCQQGNCAETKAFDPNKSSTAVFVNHDLSQFYSGGDFAIGDFFNDDLHLGDTTVKGLQMGVGINVTSFENVWGVSSEAGQPQVEEGQPAFPGSLRVMVEQGIINTQAYSIFLNEIDDSEGSILFGGVDSSKFEGELATLPIVENDNQGFPPFSDMTVKLSTFSIMNEDNTLFSTSGDLSMNSLLDTGTASLILPQEFTDKIFQQVGAKSDGRGGATVPCSAANMSVTLEFGFQGKTISVPISSLVTVSVDGRQDDCQFLLNSDVTDGLSVLGDPFLRAVYAVFDLDNKEISIAQAKFDNEPPNIVEISAGPSGVPFTSSNSTGSANATAVAFASGTGAVFASGTGAVFAAGTGVVLASGTGAALVSGTVAVGAALQSMISSESATYHMPSLTTSATPTFTAVGTQVRASFIALAAFIIVPLLLL